MKQMKYKEWINGLVLVMLISGFLTSCSERDINQKKYSYLIESVIREPFEGSWMGPYLIQDAPCQFTINYIGSSSSRSTFFSELKDGVIQLFIIDEKVDSGFSDTFRYIIKCKHNGAFFEGATFQVYEKQEGVFQMVAESEY